MEPNRIRRTIYQNLAAPSEFEITVPGALGLSLSDDGQGSQMGQGIQEDTSYSALTPSSEDCISKKQQLFPEPPLPDNSLLPQMACPTMRNSSQPVCMIAVPSLSISDTLGPPLSDDGQYSQVAHESRGSGGEVTGFTQFVLVGFSHIMRWCQGINGSYLRNVPKKTIILDCWSDTAIEDTANRLCNEDLSQSFVFLWLFDELVHEHARSGDPLFLSEFDGRLHCDGELGVVRPSVMTQLLNRSRPLMEACGQALKIVLITPLPMYVTEACCEKPNHCQGYWHEYHFKRLTHEIADLREVVLRWVSRQEDDRTMVATPHLLISDMARQAKRDPVYALKDAYSYDGVHLTCDGYQEFTDCLWDTIQNQPWKLRPPMRDMPSPMKRRLEPQRLSTRRERGRTPRQEDEEFEEREEYETTRIVTFSDTEIRAIEMGPWSGMPLQDIGPVIDEEVWATARESAYASGYDRKKIPKGLRPG